MFFLIALYSLTLADWHFTDVTQSAGVTWMHRYSSANDPSFIAAGAAAADYDGDGWVDLYVLGGENQANALFRNLGNGTFVNVAQAAGVASAGGFDCGAAFADVDGDGLLDLFVGALNASPKLYRNRGDGSFEDFTSRANLQLEGSSFSAAFADTDRDGDLDLFVAHWQSGRANFFFENDGAGHFTNATTKAGLAAHFRPDLSFTPNFADLNGDRWPDLLVASDLGHSQVFLNDGHGAFVEVTDAVITDENGMGSSVADYDNDGLLDWFVSSVGKSTPPTAKRGVTGNRLYRGLGNGHFEDVTERCGVREGYWGWGSSFADFNNDGYLDLFHTNGFLGPFAPGYTQDPSRMFVNKGDGTFAEQSADLGLNDTRQGRGVVCFDYDRDGDLDIFIANNGTGGTLMRNDGGNQANWLTVNLRGNAANTAAVGARIQLRANGVTQLREIKAGNNFLSQDPALAHFGMAQANSGVLTITWPDGTVEVFENVAANQALTYSQPARVSSGCEEQAVRWITHVTKLNGDFQTRIYAKNLGSDLALADLVAYDSTGGILGSTTLSLDADAQQEWLAEQLFGTMAVSHLAIYAPQQSLISAGYRLAQGISATAHVHEESSTQQSFYVYPGDWNIVYDGIALINTSQENISVTAALLDGSGNEIESVVLAHVLPSRAKHLTPFNTVFTEGGHLIRVITDGPAQAIFLRGTHGRSEPGLLFQVKQLPIPR